MAEALKTAGALLINLIFDATIFILLIRLLLQKFGAHYHHPFTQFVIKVTDPVVKPVQRIIPGFKGFDLAIVFLMLVLEIIEAFLMLWMKVGIVPGIIGTIVISIGELSHKIINVFFFAIIVGAIMSWVTTLRQGPLAEIIDLITEPLLRPVRRIIPMLGGFDLSPIVVLVVLQLISVLVCYPLVNYGTRLAYG